jgi:hypothetical protein
MLGVAALAAALAAAVLWAPPTGLALEWLAGSPVTTFAASACLFGLSAVRRQERLRAQAAADWLAALPVPGSAILRLISGAAAGLLAVTALLGLAGVLGRVTPGMALRLALVTAAGALAGTLAGGRPSRGGASGSPGWHYTSVRRPRPRWATAPSLLPLSYWPLAQGRLFSRPMASRVVLFALLAVPAGRRDPGEVALAVGAGCLTLFTLLSLSLAAVRAAGDAARWLAPTTIRLRVFLAALVWRVVVKQAAVLAVVIVLACAVDYPQALRVGLVLAAAYLAVSCAAVAAACAWACRRDGLGSGGRRA